MLADLLSVCQRPGARAGRLLSVGLFTGAVALSLAPGRARGQGVVIPPDAFGYYQDAFLFSDYNPSFSSRINGMAGAQAGLGADISAAAINPAGLGLMRTSELSFSPGYLSSRAESDFFGTSQTGRAGRLQIGQVGYVHARQRGAVEGGSFRGGSWGFSLSRLNQYENTRNFDALIPYREGRFNSYIDWVFAQASGLTTLPTDFFDDQSIRNPNFSDELFEVRRAYRNYLLDFDTTGGGLEFTSFVPRGDIRQQGRIRESGRQSQFDIAYGANFDDRLFIGGGIGITTLTYSETVNYTETLERPVVAADQLFLTRYAGLELDRTSVRRMNGTGINAKIGVMYQATPNWRLGGAIHTPTAQILSEESYTTLQTFWDNIPYGITATSPGQLVQGDERPQVFRFNETSLSMRSPWQVRGGATYLTPQGLLTADLAYIPYGSIRVRDRGNPNLLRGDQAAIGRLARAAMQARIGAEARVGGSGRLRAGVGLLQSPYRGDQGLPTRVTQPTWLISGGGGIRRNAFYADLSVNYFRYSRAYQVINADPGNQAFQYTPPVTSLVHNTLTQVTVGLMY